MKITVHVTSNHIKQGRRESCSLCPIGRAITPHLYRSFFYSVVGDRVILRGLDEPNAPMKGVPFPPAVVQFIETFDAGGDVAPFSFDLDGIPDAIFPLEVEDPLPVAVAPAPVVEAPDPMEELVILF